ncbi:MAG: hypothetical protein V2A73_02455, partial [Pseudomonadota bacterium]
AYEAYDARAVERILEARFKPRRLAEQIADATRGHIREMMGRSQGITNCKARAQRNGRCPELGVPVRAHSRFRTLDSRATILA